MGIHIGQGVRSLVKDILTQMIGWRFKASTLKIAISPTALNHQGSSIDLNWTGQLFAIGNFVPSVITFLTAAFVTLLRLTKK